MSLPTVIIRHCRENLKKCSLAGLEKRDDFLFLSYPGCILPSLSNYVLLDLDGPELTAEDAGSGLLLVDATWRLAEKIVRLVEPLQHVARRRLPRGIQTAYPRRQDDCSDASAGLASIEALYAAFCLLGKEAEFLLERYHWKDHFLEKNNLLHRVKTI